MHPLLEELVAPFDRMTPAEASAILDEHYGVVPSALERLDTERDDSFRVTTSRGELVLKVAHPHDNPRVIELQLAALEHAASADPGLPLQRIVRTDDGERAVNVTTAGVPRVARVFEWMPGQLAQGHSPTPAQLHASGVVLGRLSLALSTFEHPAAVRDLAWDLPQLPVLRELPANPQTAEILERFDRLVLPALAKLPQQVIHNDFHPGNLLVDPASSDYVTGILDFGDVVYSARINDLAVALAYLTTGSSPWVAAAPMIAGFDSVVDLLDGERAMLPHLVAGRLVQRVLLADLLARGRDTSARQHQED